MRCCYAISNSSACNIFGSKAVGGLRMTFSRDDVLNIALEWLLPHTARTDSQLELELFF